MRVPRILQQRDAIIATHLRQNARISLSTLARSAQMPISTVHDRLKIIQDKLVKRHTTQLNFPLLGYQLRCFTAFKVAHADRELLRETLQRHPNLNNLFHINNGFDFLAETYFASVPEFEKFLVKLSDQFRIRHVQPYYIIEELAGEQFMSNPALLHLLKIPLR